MSPERHPVVGVWVVRAPEAPFPDHVFTFHADGTMVQANPEAGNPASSDSVGMGVWRADGDVVRGRFVEVRADRASGRPGGTGVVAFEVRVTGDAFTGRAEATFRDPEGGASGPHPTALAGTRFGLDA